jgi:hypothetical protein
MSGIFYEMTEGCAAGQMQNATAAASEPEAAPPGCWAGSIEGFRALDAASLWG